ncbi:MAG TPA: pirin family protein [Azospirillum sp.]|nr:pirin family protein [Azospirillum sp.]
MQGPRDWLETAIVPRAHDIGGFEVRRALPSAQRRMVGPFIFWDQMGPAELKPGQGIDVRPHPHIGLATVTYLFDGEILHRDSLGSVQAIRPGAVNWMTAGRGIAHSERSGDATRRTGQRVFGIQSWIALPKDHEETDPAFVHHPAATLPIIEGEGKRVRVVAGQAYGERSPVQGFSAMLYVDAALDTDARLPVPAEHAERALYVADGMIAVNGDRFNAGQLLVLRSGDAITVDAETPARVLLLGGEPMDGPRHIWWNFVSSSKDRIEAAKADWKAGRFDAVPGETEFIPLPEDRIPPPIAKEP